MKHGRHILALVALLAASLPAWAAEVVTASTGAFRLDLRPSPRVSAGTETLTFSPRWEGGDTAAITLDGNPWTPAITVKGGNSGFYLIEVEK